MIKMKFKIIPFVLGLLAITFVVSCIDDINFNIDEAGDQLVIIGSITTKPGPYKVEISKAIDFFSSISSLSNRVRDARVIISSDDGQVEELTHVGSGVYETSQAGIRGEVGRSYAVTVITADGETYQSKRERIVAAPEIDSLYFQYEEREAIGANNIKVINRFAKVMVDVTDDPNEENYYAWTWKGTYQFKTFPELFTNPDGSPAPLPCSFFGCSCCICWLTTEENNELAIANDVLTNGNQIKEQVVANIPISAFQFEQKYHVNVTQRAQTKEAFEFWSLVKEQQSAATLFATPPARIRSNIVNINNPDELVWGFFEASGASEKSFFINRRDIPGALLLQSDDSIRNDCRRVLNATTSQPLFWE